MNQVDRDEWAGSLSDALLDYAIEVNAERQAESAATLSSVTAMLNRLRVEKCRRMSMDEREPGEAFCANCPDHEACMQNWPCDHVKLVHGVTSSEQQSAGSKPLWMMTGFERMEAVMRAFLRTGKTKL